MDHKRVQFIFSFIFLSAYLALILIILYLETQSSFEIKPGHDSMLGELKILIGVLTAGVAQILNFWFGNSKKAEPEAEEEQP